MLSIRKWFKHSVMHSPSINDRQWERQLRAYLAECKECNHEYEALARRTRLIDEYRYLTR